VRTWAFADGPQWSALQPSPGVFDENVFCALDRVLAEAGSRGIRVLFNLINFWSNYGGMAQYVTWSRQARGLPSLNKGQPSASASASSSESDAAAVASEFYQDPWCQNTFLNFIKTLILRRNTITGVVYRDDPTILGFAPANEPQCLCDPGCHGSTIATWTHRTAAEIKNRDPNHLVFMDCEGFWGPSYQPDSSSGKLAQLPPPISMTCSSNAASSSSGGNPYDCTYNGCDFVSDCSSPFIDVACCHMYPDLWLSDAQEERKLEFAMGWLDAHIDACANILKKPLILSEFGKHGAKNVYFEAILSRCFNHMQQGRPLAGSMFWTAAAESYPDYDGFTIYLPRNKKEMHQGEGDNVADLIKEHAAMVRKLNEGAVKGGGGVRSSNTEEEREKQSIARMISKIKGKLESKLEQIKQKFSL
jgi:mannan endo-1,4-beta-mannosidase